MQKTTLHDNPLKGKNFISTRELGSSAELSDMISNAGGKLLEFPMIETKSVSGSKHNKEILMGVDLYDWIVFTSANGVKYFFEALNKLGKRMNENRSVKFAVIGGKTSEKLREYGFSCDFLSEGQNSRGFVEELKKIFGNSFRKVLWPTGNMSKNIIENGLKGMADFKRLNLYITCAPDDVNQNIVKVIEEYRYELIYFYSPSAFRNFMDVLNKRVENKKIRAACIGPTTEKACVNYGITPIFTASKPNSQCMFEETLRYLQHNR